MVRYLASISGTSEALRGDDALIKVPGTISLQGTAITLSIPSQPQTKEYSVLDENNLIRAQAVTLVKHCLDDVLSYQSPQSTILEPVFGLCCLSEILNVQRAEDVPACIASEQGGKHVEKSQFAVGQSVLEIHICLLFILPVCRVEVVKTKSFAFISVVVLSPQLLSDFSMLNSAMSRRCVPF